MEKQVRDTEEQINFMQLLKELAETRFTLAKINAQLDLTKFAEKNNEKVEKIREALNEQAKKYGAKLEKIEKEYANGNAEKRGIYEDFKQQLSDVTKEYDKIKKDITDKKCN